MYIIFFAAILCVVLGIMIKYFKCYWLIAGYNTMPEEKRKNVDIESLGRFIGNYMLLLGLLLAIGGVLLYAGYKTLGIILIVFPQFILTPYVLIRSQKYDKNLVEADGSMKKSAKVMYRIIVGVIAFVFIITLGMILYGAKEPNITVTNEKIKIGGMYASVVYMEDIEDTLLLNTIPEVLKKNDGFDFGNILKGQFTLENIGKGKVYINNGKSPYLYLRLKNGYVIINFRNNEKTQELYNEINSLINR